MNNQEIDETVDSYLDLILDDNCEPTVHATNHSLVLISILLSEIAKRLPQKN